MIREAGEFLVGWVMVMLLLLVGLPALLQAIPELVYEIAVPIMIGAWAIYIVSVIYYHGEPR